MVKKSLKKTIDAFLINIFFVKGPCENLERSLIPVFLSLLLLSVFWAYIPGVKLFFRNDDWELIGLLEPLVSSSSNNLRHLLQFLQGKQTEVIKHLHPVSLAISTLKYSVFGNNFTFHFILSLSFHLLNTILIYVLGLQLSTRKNAALLGAVLFGSSAFISDTLLWTGQFAFIFITTLTLVSICLHPALLRSRFTLLGNIGFYTVTAIAPLVFELGLITVLLALGLLLVKRPLKVFPLFLLTLFLIFPIITRVMLIGSVVTGVYFVGIPQLFYNIFISATKLLLGLFGTSYETKVTDTLYILNPDPYSGLTYVSFLLMVMSILCVWDFMKSGNSSRQLKANCLLFLFMSSLPFIMTSFSCDPSNPNPDLSHQMPRYFYLPAALVAIVLAQALGLKFQHLVLWLSMSVFLGLAGLFSIPRYVSILRPYTDDLKQSIVTFADTGRLTRRRYLGVRADAHRLDWSFNEKNIKAYLKMNYSKE
ncbi:MAG: hypothetical protein HY730_01125 [Candidatus Tectomicrobia bacterium]|uniref:Uncharacterized protein n=1 Tax=Tectimicrobiota bacterium TaxID=2528274 RepID=A0A933GJG7_UNCTE|nr:hypothetical protein [Candidatus Tectomicrobia bacterium]